MIPSRIRLYCSVVRFLKMLLSVCNTEKPQSEKREEVPQQPAGQRRASVTFSRISKATAQWWFSRGEMSL